MSRRKFALSWGRKLFFGLSWPLSLVLGLVYLRSSILPVTTLDWVFFVTTFIGYFGLLNALAYFFVFVPIVALMPSYYVSRFLSVNLILALNLFITVDALTFANYHHHFYGFLSDLILEKGIQNFIGTSGIALLSIALFVFGLLIWIRGEMIWRSMQTRFSNPVKNWYLVLILLFIAVGKATFYYGELHPKLSEVFPFDRNFQKSATTEHPDNRKFYYPRDELFCQGKANPNIIFITLREWRERELNADSMPSVFHMKRHAISYNANYGVSLDPVGGRFSLLYSIPSSYLSSVKSVQPAIYQELSKRKYEVLEFHGAEQAASPADADDKAMGNFRKWLESDTGEEITPLFFSFSFKQHSSEVDKYIQEIVLALQKEQMLPGTHIIITGEFQGRDGKLIPLMYVQPDRRSEEVSGVTSQYDIVPTIMQKAWGCKNAHKVASVGQSLDQPGRDWLLLTGENEFRILDLKNNTLTTVASDKVSDSTLDASRPSTPQHGIVFDALKMMASFSKFK